VNSAGTALADQDRIASQAAISAALATVFRGKFCDILLPNRKSTTFAKNEVIYDIGNKERTLFFLRSGFVKVGTITPDGNELIYEIRKAGDVIGELCACKYPRPDRAVALEQLEAIPVPYQEVIEALRKSPDLLVLLLDVLCKALTSAYEQIVSLAMDDTLHRLVKILLDLAAKLGHPAGKLVELPTYLTQEDISHMVAARRERISTALNFLRRQGAIQYSIPGRLVLNLEALKTYVG
jgi:CRP/FNR family transcriptional regulator, cyclic AMP receptor protein